MSTNDKETHEAYIKTTIGIGPNYSITLSAGHPCSKDVLVRDATIFFNRLQRSAYGTGWLRRPASKRPAAIGFFEHADTNPHLHIAARLPTKALRSAADDGEQVWRAIRVAGPYHAEKTKEVERWTRYIAKDAWKNEGPDFVYTPGGSWIARQALKSLNWWKS